MEKYLLTTGCQLEADIDSYVSIIVYKKYLELLGNDVIAYIANKPNHSFPDKFMKIIEGKYIMKLPADYLERKCILIDVSDPRVFDKAIPLDNIYKVIDHHAGDEEFWEKRPNTISQIEYIGSVATIVWREIKNQKLESKISNDYAKMIYTAIMSNTLHLNAEITQEEDKKYYYELKDRLGLDESYDQDYYSQVDKKLEKNMENILIHDSRIHYVNDHKLYMLQLELWNADGFINRNVKSIDKIFKRTDAEYKFISIPSIKQKITYLYSNQKEARELLSNIFGIKFDKNIAKYDKLILRKEIKRKIIASI